MIDFTQYVKNHPSKRAYAGANGIKKGFLYKNEPYMLKIEARDKGSNTYKNSVICEYISCKIFSLLNIPTQEVILGRIKDNGKIKTCVACRDFKEENEYLYDFISIKNSISDESNSSGTGTELKEVLNAIKKQDYCDFKKVLENFWDMFVVDSYLGNFDRHNGNWGILVNDKNKMGRLAPVFDCGSCLYPKATDDQLKTFLANPDEMKKRVSIFPTSAIKENGVKINYKQYLNSTENKDCLKAILKIVPTIEQKTDEIKNLINDIKSITTIRKEFYIEILNLRFQEILKSAHVRAIKLVKKDNNILLQM